MSLYCEGGGHVHVDTGGGGGGDKELGVKREGGVSTVLCLTLRGRLNVDFIRVEIKSHQEFVKTFAVL